MCIVVAEPQRAILTFTLVSMEKVKLLVLNCLTNPTERVYVKNA